MPYYIVTCDETISVRTEYVVEATSPEEAVAKAKEGDTVCIKHEEPLETHSSEVNPDFPPREVSNKYAV